MAYRRFEQNNGNLEIDAIKIYQFTMCIVHILVLETVRKKNDTEINIFIQTNCGEFWCLEYLIFLQNGYTPYCNKMTMDCPSIQT